MKSITEIIILIGSNSKVMEKELNIKIRNGQTREGIIKALTWVLLEGDKRWLK